MLRINRDVEIRMLQQKKKKVVTELKHQLAWRMKQSEVAQQIQDGTNHFSPEHDEEAESPDQGKNLFSILYRLILPGWIPRHSSVVRDFPGVR